MRKSDFTKLLRRAAAVSAEHRNLAIRVGEAFESRYGTTHSDLDVDDLIETLDYGAAMPRGFGADYVDKVMADLGHPPKQDEEYGQEVSDV